MHVHTFSLDRSPWSFDPSAMSISPTGYVGLRNLGATCYMNSLMQQLFMIPEFRYGLLANEATDTLKPAERADSLLYQLQCLFGFLQESQKKSYDARGFCRAYKVGLV